MSISRSKYLENNPNTLRGENNPVFGKICISNNDLKQRNFICEKELENYIKLGWIKGMNKFKEKFE